VNFSSVNRVDSTKITFLTFILTG